MMDKARTDFLVREGRLKARKPDIPRVRSMIDSAKDNIKVVRKIPITPDSATLVFREIYESIRQVGDAKLWSIGFEPLSHDVSMEILKDMNIKEAFRLHSLDRFRRMRNDANYRGYKITAEQAIEISDFWDRCAKEIIMEIESSIR
jgi:hypothetical protein